MKLDSRLSERLPNVRCVELEIRQSFIRVAIVQFGPRYGRKKSHDCGPANNQVGSFVAATSNAPTSGPKTIAPTIEVYFLTANW